MKPRQFVSNKASLAHGGSGGYTVIPVMNGQLLDSPFHIHRLIQSYNDNEEKLTNDNVSIARMIYDDIVSQNISKHHNGCLTCVLCNEIKSNLQLPSASSLFTSLNEASLKSISTSSSSSSSSGNFKTAEEVSGNIVETFKYQRNSPRKKDIQWVQDRLFIENQRKLPSSLEILLLDDNGQSILEGLTSNFFAFNSHTNTVYTAPDDVVLPGSMSRLLLAACKIRNISIIRDAPSIQNLCSDSILDAAFITSAIKIFSFVDQILYNTQDDSSNSNNNSRDSYDYLTKIQLNRPTVLEGLRLFLLHGLQSQDPHFLAPLIPYPLWWSPPSADGPPTYDDGVDKNNKSSGDTGENIRKRHDDDFNLMYQYINLI